MAFLKIDENDKWWKYYQLIFYEYFGHVDLPRTIVGYFCWGLAGCLLHHIKVTSILSSFIAMATLYFPGIFIWSVLMGRYSSFLIGLPLLFFYYMLFQSLKNVSFRLFYRYKMDNCGYAFQGKFFSISKRAATLTFDLVCLVSLFFWLLFAIYFLFNGPNGISFWLAIGMFGYGILPDIVFGIFIKSYRNLLQKTKKAIDPFCCWLWPVEAPEEFLIDCKMNRNSVLRYLFLLEYERDF